LHCGTAECRRRVAGVAKSMRERSKEGKEERKEGRKEGVANMGRGGCTTKMDKKRQLKIREKPLCC